MKFETIDFLISLIEQCKRNCVVEMQFNWYSPSFLEEASSEISAKKIISIADCKTSRQIEFFKSTVLDNYKFKDSKFGDFKIWEGGLNLFITHENKNEITKILKESFDNYDICHCQIYTIDKHVAECYDTFNHCKLDSNTFTFTEEEKKKYEENDIDIYIDSFE